MPANPIVCLQCQYAYGMRFMHLHPIERTLECRLSLKVRKKESKTDMTRFYTRICKWTLKEKKMIVNQNFDVPSDCPYKLEQLVSDL